MANEQTPILSNGLLHHIMHYASDAVMVVAAHEMILLDVDQHSCHLIGCAREDLIGQPLASVECSLQDFFFGKN